MVYQWFRLYSEIRTDPKMLRLTPAERWAWIGILCMASESTERGMVRIAEGVPYEPNELAKALDVSEEDIQGLLAHGIKMGMLKVTEAGIEVLHFMDRQYENPSDRPEATRDRQRKSRASHELVTKSHDIDRQTDSDRQTEVAASAAVLAAQHFGATQHTQDRISQLIATCGETIARDIMEICIREKARTWRFAEVTAENLMARKNGDEEELPTVVIDPDKIIHWTKEAAHGNRQRPA